MSGVNQSVCCLTRRGRFRLVLKPRRGDLASKPLEKLLRRLSGDAHRCTSSLAHLLLRIAFRLESGVGHVEKLLALPHHPVSNRSRILSQLRLGPDVVLVVAKSIQLGDWRPIRLRCTVLRRPVLSNRSVDPSNCEIRVLEDHLGELGDSLCPTICSPVLLHLIQLTHDDARGRGPDEDRHGYNHEHIPGDSPKLEPLIGKPLLHAITISAPT